MLNNIIRYSKATSIFVCEIQKHFKFKNYKFQLVDASSALFTNRIRLFATLLHTFRNYKQVIGIE